MTEPPQLAKLKIDRSAALPRPGRHRWLKIGLALAAAGAIAALFASRAGGKPEVDVVTISLAWPSQNLTLLNATGYVVAQRKAALSSKATGRLEWLGVLEGARVKAGDVLARLESRDQEAALAQAQANIQVAQANLEQGRAELADAQQANQRAHELLAQRFIAAATADAAQARYNKARAAVAAQKAAIAMAQAGAQAAQAALEQTRIRAPFDGVILTKNANVGDNITPFSSAADSKGAVVTIADMETLEVEADVSESSLAKIRPAQPAEIQLDAFPDLRLAGSVSRMVPTVDRSKATLLVKVRFDDRDARILPDMSAKVAFLSQPVPAADRAPVLAVQPAALATRDGNTVVFIVADGKVRQVPVTAGRKVGELVQLVQGPQPAGAAGAVKAGDRAVLKPGPQLRDGQEVRLAGKP
ncbi:efflux RND transporter periplasmic adaptor subunit [Duganella sp. FT92W]|uniref:Efflux RND transporter periplasmic adaptor subunit n=1 Tax=Pseudoduganella rivuli TaxID=2666085 RepID=A0A7X2IT49_9BURK|nr:efflux RND transporter periplasmic adaptor subunit [Pseudoduganella rivuli]MRV75625.1 efflux RND transporter periplasmic adaptor subunit [Pseudoduganella rivuli]